MADEGWRRRGNTGSRAIGGHDEQVATFRAQDPIDGGLAIDNAVAKLARLPEREVPGKVMEGYIGVPHKAEYGFGDLDAAASGKTFTAPNGIALNATYINYLRRIVPRSARFRMTEKRQPVIVV